LDTEIIVVAAVAVVALGLLALVLVLSRRRPGENSTTIPRGDTGASVVCVSGPDVGRRAAFRNARVTLGRLPGSDVLVDHLGVSGRHAEVVHHGGIFWLEDVGSRNGVYIDGRRIQRTQITDGMKFSIGPDEFVLTISGAVAQRDAGVTASVRVPPIEAPPPNRAVQPPLAQQYELQEPALARGGQATVYKATQRATGRIVVVKCLNASLQDDQSKYMRAKFEQQIVIGRTLRHQNLVEIIGGNAYGADQAPYLVEEFLPGGTLKARMAKQGRIPEAEVQRIVGQLCSALAYLHDRGIIHKDVTPDNMMFTGDGSVKLIDLGIARFAGMPVLTAQGMLAGKARYLSPEQARGQLISTQTDLYSLGIVAFEMLTGRPPFSGEGVRGLEQHVKEEAPPIRSLVASISTATEQAVKTALAKDPAGRFPNARAMAAAFGATVPPPSAPGKTVNPLVLRNLSTGRMVTITDVGPIQRTSLDPNDSSISRRHGELQFRAGSWLIAEITGAPSANGLYVNEMRIAEGDWVLLNAGDTVRFGRSLWTCILQGIH
jgi:serine/threonine protein kinase